MKPIIFHSEAEVLAIIAGFKGMFREPIKGLSSECEHTKLIFNPSVGQTYAVFSTGISDRQIIVQCPYQPGDVLYLAQEWRKVVGVTNTYLDGEIIDRDDPHIGYEFKGCDYYFPDRWSPINDEFHLSDISPLCKKNKWQRAGSMPEEAAQLFLRVLGVGVSRLQNLTNQDLLDEGLTSMAAWVGDREIAISEFKNIWDNSLKPTEIPLYGWDYNPWVFVIRFERISDKKFVANKGEKMDIFTKLTLQSKANKMREQKWISIEESLPNLHFNSDNSEEFVSEMVIATDGAWPHYGVFITDANRKLKGFFDCEIKQFIEGITCWMPWLN